MPAAPPEKESSMPPRSIRTFTVLPHLPERLQALQKLAYNLWWCWNPEAVALFRRIDADIFESVDHNPVKLLSRVSQARLQELEEDDGFLVETPGGLLPLVLPGARALELLGAMGEARPPRGSSARTPRT